MIAVVGPTGTGKSDLAIELALRLGGEVVNADALQFYRGLDIGTAKLAPSERRGVPHHLLDVLDIHEEASVAAFQDHARAAFDDIQSRGLHPVLVGGSGLYVRAALDVIEFPPTDPAVRRRIEGELDARGEAVLRARLAAVDPDSAARIGDARRLVRALEVHELTGRPFSAFMPTRNYARPAVQLGLRMERAALHERLGARVEHMVDAGLLEEVRRLDAAGLRGGRTASRAIGYAQFLAVLDGTLDVRAAVEETATATRRFARRQITWFTADPRVHWLDATDPELPARAASAVVPFPHSPTGAPPA
ncbi:tRNA (adenosine(37)-N6)-dimethylallyltransferase MiaA [Zafaria sp. Z1313]|uniref:tRNA (adenosine(37)-N6)-dimethylallyltransferase MiaA n=1 Tax=unclassified Zafaria TaxID=2828765 RepID=UPI002E772E85|nr:tRNA (adenosine(37)-N6)-dimethylallyltransferase MiaA [Zafaria sp. J156]MEE1621973.1 tRNA (adenosine(37)-N6)-dimethylallyltransferase MiaA [Zafaria sp. J156]